MRFELFASRLTHGGINGLEVYCGLGVRDVWFWRGGILEVYELAGDEYERRERSALLPDLDLVELARNVDSEDQTESVRRYRETLRAS